MYWYGCKYKKEITHYSPFFEDRERCLEWYNNFGVNLEKMFNRTLVFMDK